MLIRFNVSKKVSNDFIESLIVIVKNCTSLIGPLFCGNVLFLREKREEIRSGSSS